MQAYSTHGSWLYKYIFAWFINDYGLISTKHSFRGYSEEHRMTKREEFLSLSEGKIVSGSFSIDLTKTIERIKIPHKKQDCSD